MKMGRFQLPVGVVVMLTLLLCNKSSLVMCKSSILQVMAVVPTAYGSYGITQLPNWGKGEEMLPGAYLAAKEINAISNLLYGYQIEIIPIGVPQCELSEGIVPFVEEIISNNNIVGIVGYFCHNIAQHLSRIAHLTTNTVQVSATSLEGTQNSSPSHLQHGILPLVESTALATTRLLQTLGWNKIAVISNQHPNYVDSKRAFLRSAEEYGIHIVRHLGTFHSPKEYLQDLQMYGIKIVVAFVPQSEAVDILCTAHRNGFKWPDYAWIFTGIRKPETFTTYCQVDAINNAIFLHLSSTQLNLQKGLPSGLNYSTYYDVYLEELVKSSSELNVSLQSNPYANVLYDSIWAVALTTNRSLSALNERNLSLTDIHQGTGIEIRNVLEEQLSRLSFQGATGLLNFSHSAAAVQTSVEVLQFQNRHPVQIGLYYHSLDQLTLNGSVLGVIPSDRLDRIYLVLPAALTILLSFIITICFILTMVSMCLFINFRNKPAIKATSFSLSLCMFIGCYFLFTSSLFHTIITGTPVHGNQVLLQKFICMFDVSIANIGSDIVLTTVVAKTLRIYYIFKTFGTVSRAYSDLGLFILITFLVSVKIIMLIAWASSDAAYVVYNEQFMSLRVPPFFQVTQVCWSKHDNVWHFSLIGYSAILMSFMVLLAVLTRKIKRRDYKDSKKINILVVAITLDISFGMSLWLIFRSNGDTLLAGLVFSFSITVVAVLCQVILFLPKILPLVVQCHKW